MSITHIVHMHAQMVDVCALRIFHTCYETSTINFPLYIAHTKYEYHERAVTLLFVF